MANRFHKKTFGTMSRGLIHMLELYSNRAKKDAQLYMKEMDEAEEKARLEEERRLKKLAAELEKKKIQEKYYNNTVNLTSKSGKGLPAPGSDSDQYTSDEDKKKMR